MACNAVANVGVLRARLTFTVPPQRNIDVQNCARDLTLRESSRFAQHVGAAVDLTAVVVIVPTVHPVDSDTVGR